MVQKKRSGKIVMNHYIDQLTAMRMNVRGGHASQHKAIMMLAVIDLIASGETDGNRIVYGPELLEHFRRYFDVVKNHHWAMDQELIFPCADNLWHVRKDIDDRIDSQRSLIDLHGKNIIFPEQKQFAPKQQALAWREQRLKAG